jgi:hypothetical protein
MWWAFFFLTVCHELSQLFILRRLSIVSIQAALDLKRGGNKYFYMCSLSSRCFLLLKLIFQYKFDESWKAEKDQVVPIKLFTELATTEKSIGKGTRKRILDVLLISTR